MSDFDLRPYSASDAFISDDKMVDTVSSDWAIVVDGRAVGRLQADEQAGVIAVADNSQFANAAADRFLEHHLLECDRVMIRFNGAERQFTRH